MGRIYLTEGPFFSSGYAYNSTPPNEYPSSPSEYYDDKTTYYEMNTYDDRGRIVDIESPHEEDGPVSTGFDYSGFTTTITDPDGNQKDKKKDHLGRIIQVTEYAQAGQQHTYYTYNAASDLLTVTDAADNDTTIIYDTLGRKKNMTDPDMGFWEYTYDENSNLITQTDEKDQVITFQYDELNRIKQKSYSTSDPTVNFYYDNLTPGKNGRGRLYYVTNGNVTTTYVAYDEMGREENVSKTITGDPTVYTTQYDYDLSGKKTTITYPDSYVVTNAYYPGSNLLYTVTGSDLALHADISDYEPTGKIGNITHSNGANTTYTYNALTTRLSGAVSMDASQSDIQDRSYNYSGAGDIEQIADSVNSITYTYTYDYLHRLKTETNTGSYDPVTYNYDAIGNITS